MHVRPTVSQPTLLQEIEAEVRRTTHGRIRNLSVEEEGGRVIVRGHAPSRHTKQLALQAALGFVSGDGFGEQITVA
jgi:hypothetical protein